MPTYDYVCDACKHEFEEFQYMSEEPLKKCPQCGKKKLRRLIGTGAAILFKGSGFYQTDYRSESYKSAAKSDSTATSGAKASNGESPGKTDTTAPADASTQSAGKSSPKSPKSKP